MWLSAREQQRKLKLRKMTNSGLKTEKRKGNLKRSIGGTALKVCKFLFRTRSIENGNNKQRKFIKI